jgi:DnaJ-class molecular chaperone
MGYVPSLFCPACGERNHHGLCAKQIIYRRTCQKCQGGGEVHWNDGTLPRGSFANVKCRRCNGTGKVTISYRRE